MCGDCWSLVYTTCLVVCSGLFVVLLLHLMDSWWTLTICIMVFKVTVYCSLRVSTLCLSFCISLYIACPCTAETVPVGCNSRVASGDLVLLHPPPHQTHLPGSLWLCPPRPCCTQQWRGCGLGSTKGRGHLHQHAHPHTGE